jgi:hypothetical protein
MTNPLVHLLILPLRRCWEMLSLRTRQRIARGYLMAVVLSLVVYSVVGHLSSRDVAESVAGVFFLVIWILASTVIFRKEPGRIDWGIDMDAEATYRHRDLDCCARTGVGDPTYYPLEYNRCPALMARHFLSEGGEPWGACNGGPVASGRSLRYAPACHAAPSPPSCPSALRPEASVPLFVRDLRPASSATSCLLLSFTRSKN